MLVCGGITCTKKCGERINASKRASRSRGQQVPKPLGTMSVLHTLKGMHKEITAKRHLHECVGFPIPCPNNCGHEKIQCWFLADHNKVCPLEPVKCPFFEAGCAKMILWKDLAAHKASNTEHHLELMITETVHFTTLSLWQYTITTINMQLLNWIECWIELNVIVQLLCWKWLTIIVENGY